MRKIVLAVVAGSAFASPAWAEPNLGKGFDGALRGCEEWVLNPASWAEGTSPFIEAVGLGDEMKRVDRVEEVNFPPPQLRCANHNWRINSAPNAGYMLVVSDELPMCHITGGGGVDLQPSIESDLASDDFKLRWQSETSTAQNGMTTSVFRSKKEPAFSMIISRAGKAGERLDRVQVVATAVFDIGN